jgi:RIO kinase 1
VSLTPDVTPDVTRDVTPDVSPDFSFDFRALDGPAAGQRFSTYWDVQPLQRGPQPPPDWLVTDRAALDTELGVLKTGKEAEVYLLERGVPDGASCVLAAKRYRSSDHRTFHRNAGYTEGRRLKDSREARAVKNKSSFGREVAAAQWASAEWDALNRLWLLGLAVPYPVQIDGTEILMEWVSHADETAPRLVQTKPSQELLASYFDQLTAFLGGMAGAGLVHGDLSAYNTLAAGDRLVFIDLPQVVDLVGNPHGADFLLRDCTNMCRWFRTRGLEVDEHELFGEVMAQAF